jgi:hypothetical protein
LIGSRGRQGRDFGYSPIAFSCICKLPSLLFGRLKFLEDFEFRFSPLSLLPYAGAQPPPHPSVQLIKLACAVRHSKIAGPAIGSLG